MKPLLSLVALLFVNSLHAQTVRIGSNVKGHIHPSVCISKKGTIVVIYSLNDMKDLRLTRSTDGGKTWTEPTPYGPTEKVSIYPGSLTTLKDGRIVHCWNTWYGEGKEKSRFVQFSISDDEGKTWGETKSLPKNPKAQSVIRHPFIELPDGSWLLSLMDQTVVYDPKTEKLTPFGKTTNQGLVPIVRTSKDSFVSGKGFRSTDTGMTWNEVKPFPDLAGQGWRHDMTTLANGWLIATQVEGPGVGGKKWRWIISKDDGKTWDMTGGYLFYSQEREIGGRACPKTIQIDAETLGTVYYDTDAKQDGGAGIFFLRTPVKNLGK